MTKSSPACYAVGLLRPGGVAVSVAAHYLCPCIVTQTDAMMGVMQVTLRSADE
jgi:hypothetical protein